jgi:hypothetical protein
MKGIPMIRRLGLILALLGLCHLPVSAADTPAQLWERIEEAARQNKTNAAAAPDLAALEARLQAAELALTDLRQSVVSLQAETASLRAAVFALQAADTALDARVKKLEGTALPLPVPPPGGKRDIGIYYLPVGQMAAWKARGGTLGHEWAHPDGRTTAYLNAAQAAGLKVMLELAFQGGGASDHAQLTAYMTPYKSHPALHSWSLTDEPDLGGRNPAQILAAYQHAKTVDPAHPISLTMTCEPSAAVYCAQFANSADVINLDWYPVNYGLPAADFMASAVRRGRGVVPVGKPLNPVVQTFDWKNALGTPPYDSGKTRVPTWQEVRDMSLVALREGKNSTAVWFYYFGTSAGQGMDAFNKPAWDNMATITAAIQAWTPTPALRAGQKLKPLPSNLVPIRRAPMTRP